jgi:hypothetical protein
MFEFTGNNGLEGGSICNILLRSARGKDRQFVQNLFQPEDETVVKRIVSGNVSLQGTEGM